MVGFAGAKLHKDYELNNYSGRFLYINVHFNELSPSMM